MSSENPNVPTIASPLELREGMEADFNCSTPYACLQEPITLQWQGQDPARSVTSNLQKLEPTGISHLETLHMTLTWQDHGQTLRCQLSVAEHKTEGEILLQVQCERAGGHSLVMSTRLRFPRANRSSSSLWKQPSPLRQSLVHWVLRSEAGREGPLGTKSHI